MPRACFGHWLLYLLPALPTHCSWPRSLRSRWRLHSVSGNDSSECKRCTGIIIAVSKCDHALSGKLGTSLVSLHVDPLVNSTLLHTIQCALLLSCALPEAHARKRTCAPTRTRTQQVTHAHKPPRKRTRAQARTCAPTTPHTLPRTPSRTRARPRPGHAHAQARACAHAHARTHAPARTGGARVCRNGALEHACKHPRAPVRACARALIGNSIKLFNNNKAIQ